MFRLAATLTLAAGVLAGTSFYAYQHGPTDANRCAETVQDLIAIRMALEQLGTDFNGSYPMPAEVRAALLKTYPDGWSYLPLGLPPNRWGGPGVLVAGQAGHPWPAGLKPIRDIALGVATLSAVGTELGDGHFPGDGPDDALTYGAILYDYAPDNQLYVLYAIGRKGRKAVVTGGSSNGSC